MMRKKRGKWENRKDDGNVKNPIRKESPNPFNIEWERGGEKRNKRWIAFNVEFPILQLCVCLYSWRVSLLFLPHELLNLFLS